MYVGEEKNESMTSDKHKENAFHKIFLSTHSFSYILWYFVICSWCLDTVSGQWNKTTVDKYLQFGWFSQE